MSDLCPLFDILGHSAPLFSFSVERVYECFSCRAFGSSDKGVEKKNQPSIVTVSVHLATCVS